MSGKRVTESVGRHLLLHIGLLAIALHDVEDHNARQLPSETIQKDIVLEASLHVEFVAKQVIVMDFAQSALGNRHDTFLPTLAEDLDNELDKNGIFAFPYDDENIEVEFCGFCTDICVVSNVMILKASWYDFADITVDSSCCAGVTPESHEAALTTMRMCQIDVI